MYLGKQPSRGLVGSADIDDNAVTLAKMAHQDDGSIITYGTDTAPVLLAPDTSGEVLTTKGAGALPAFDAVSAGFTLATEQASTSGTSVTFGSIPAGVKMIIVMAKGVSFTGSSDGLDLTIGDSGGLEASSYVNGVGSYPIGGTPWSAAGSVESTAAFEIAAGNNPAQVLYIQATLTLENSSTNSWLCSAQGYQTDNTNTMHFAAGIKSLSGELTQLSLSGGTFDAGAINIMYM